MPILFPLGLLGAAALLFHLGHTRAAIFTLSAFVWIPLAIAAFLIAAFWAIMKWL